MIYTDPKFDISREVLMTLRPELKPNNSKTSTSGNNKTSNSSNKTRK